MDIKNINAFWVSRAGFFVYESINSRNGLCRFLFWEDSPSGGPMLIVGAATNSHQELKELFMSFGNRKVTPKQGPDGAGELFHGKIKWTNEEMGVETPENRRHIIRKVLLGLEN